MPHSRPSRAAARFRIVAVPALLSSALVVGLIGAFSASASADAGSLVVGDAPVQLTQPVDPGIAALVPRSDAPEKGMFGPQITWPIVPIHAALARNGHLVTFGTPMHDASQNGMVFDDWDPTSTDDEASHVDSESMHSYDSFCNSLVSLDDGRLLMVGGNSAMSTMLYDPVTHEEEMGPSVVQQRWYATALRMTDGRVIVLGGGNSYKTPSSSPDESDRVALTPEVGDGVHGWSKLSGATSSELFGLDDGRWWYPRAFNAKSGTVIGFSSNRIWRLDPTGSGSVMHLSDLPYDPKVSGSAVMFAPGRVLVAGGGQDNPEDDHVGTAQAVVVDIDARTPTVESTGEMQHGRNWLNLTVLPTGEVLANGGTTVGTEAGAANSMKQAEVWNPSTGTWTDAATAQRTRTYHSTALLLPSGAVFTGGGGVPGPEDNFNAELYYPASLFDRDADGRVRWASRPTITTVAGSLTYGGTIAMRIGGDRTVASASLITLPSVTHSESTDQRRVPLTIDQVGDEVHATLPASTDLLPPGDYELTVVDTNGVPSPAQIVTIRKDAPGLVTPAEARAATTTTAPSADPSASPSTDPAPSTAPAPAASELPAPAPAPAPSAAAPAPSAAAPVATTAVRAGATVSLQLAGRSGFRVVQSGSAAVVRKVGRSSSASARRSATWIVRAGLAGEGGWSLESAARRGSYLTAPADGTGAMGVARRSRSSAFAARATFSVVPGVLEHDTSIRSAARTDRYLRTKGARLVIGTLPRSTAGLSASTFVVGKGLASAR